MSPKELLNQQCIFTAYNLIEAAKRMVGQKHLELVPGDPKFEHGIELIQWILQKPRYAPFNADRATTMLTNPSSVDDCASRMAGELKSAFHALGSAFPELIDYAHAERQWFVDCIKEPTKKGSEKT